tara:strand:- start:1652 stop:2125 length:474 start_codon:yes stop_codon:yes gene_type:complete
MTKKQFNIHDWQAEQRLTEHTVNFSKDDMATLHNDGELVKADDDGKDHTYTFKGDLKEQGFDDRFKDAMGGAGFSDEEQDDIMSRDIGDGGSPFPGTDNVSPFTAKAKDYTEKFKQEYREMSDDGIDEFNKEIIEYLLNAFPSAQATAKVFFSKKGL